MGESLSLCKRALLTLFMLKKKTKWYKNRWIASWGCGKSFKSFCNLYCWITLLTPNFFSWWWCIKKIKTTEHAHDVSKKSEIKISVCDILLWPFNHSQYYWTKQIWHGRAFFEMIWLSLIKPAIDPFLYL